MALDGAKIAVIVETIEKRLHISDYLRSGDDEISHFHKGWCDLAYEILDICGATEEEVSAAGDQTDTEDSSDK